MSENARVAVVGVGNNTSALVQGISLYRKTGNLTGVRSPEISGLRVDAIDFVAAFAISEAKVGGDLHDAIFLSPNNFPRLNVELPPSGVTVQRGLVDSAGIERVAEALNGAEVLLYSAPSGRPASALAYAEAALAAGAAFVNTTSDAVARDPSLLRRFEDAGLPLIGDDGSPRISSALAISEDQPPQHRGARLGRNSGQPGCAPESA